MSTNLHLNAYIPVTLPNGNLTNLYESFDLQQTPTNVTYSIIESSDIYQAYKDYILQLSESQPQYGLKWKRDWLTHLRDLDRWLAKMKLNEYKINWYTL